MSTASCAADSGARGFPIDCPTALGLLCIESIVVTLAYRFMYGDGVGAPMAETGSSAPHAIVENQNPLLNELGQYKLARFELRIPKVDGGSAH